jgi:K+-transporting ATPase c subunit
MDCPHPPPGQVSNQGEASTSKDPSVSLITPAVQLVTTRSRARTEQWADQDRVREQAQNWVEEANAQNNAERRTQETQRAATGKAVLTETTRPSGSGTEPDISDLAGIQVTMTLEQLLRLVPRFRDGIRRTLEGTVSCGFSHTI